MKRRIFITGDKHGNFDFLPKFCATAETTKDDVLIILGDAGINFFKGRRDRNLKDFIASAPITLVCVHGNHERRPSTLPNYQRVYLPYLQTMGYMEHEYPTILFPDDGQMIINNKTFLVLGGAYSVDKYYRLKNKWSWFADEQMSEDVRNIIRKWTDFQPDYKYVLSHAAPLSMEPRHLFLSEVDQNNVDRSTETFLEEIKNKINFEHWYFGHYHADEYLGNGFELFYNQIKEI